MAKFTEKQRELMRMWKNDELRRINLLEGSVSSGKTWVSLILWAFWVASMPQDGLYLMCAKSLTTLKRNCLLLLEELVGTNNFSFSPSAKEGKLFGRHVILEGANDIRSESKIRGVTLQGAYCDELTQFPEDFFAMLLSRLRLPGAKLIATTNPDRPSHWLKENYIDRANKLDLLDVKFTIDDNTMLPADYVDSIKREYTGVFYERFILGLWTLAQGLIYPMYQEAMGNAPDTEPQKSMLSIDYGTQNAFAAGLWEKHGEVWYMTREYYYSGRDEGQQKTDEEYAQDLDRVFADVNPGKTLTVIIDPSAASFIALLRKRNHRYKVLKADNDVANGIRETATAMKTGKIKISPDCVNWKKEVQGYVWDEKSGEDKPVKENDHHMDQMRYFVKTMRIAKVKEKYIPLHERHGW